MLRKILLCLFCIFSSILVRSQVVSAWSKTAHLNTNLEHKSTGNKFVNFKLSEQILKAGLPLATSNTFRRQTSVVELPNIDGKIERFEIWESSNFDSILQKKYPAIRSYQGVGIDDRKAKVHLSMSQRGLSSMVLRSNKPAEFIEKSLDKSSDYQVFVNQDSVDDVAKLVCMTAAKTNFLSNNSRKMVGVAPNEVIRTIRLALSCTGEYANYFGGTVAGALQGMNATLTRVNGIFARDFGVRLELIANNDKIVFTDASTDPYSVANVGVNGVWGLELQRTLTREITDAGYDMGHLFGASGGGGDAGCIGCVCLDPQSNDDQNAKGSAFTSPINGKPEGDVFDIDFVSHEMAHQLGANHTFSYDVEPTGVSIEPGSGSTIMGYAGVSGNYDIQKRSDDYFAYASILQVKNFLATTTCTTTVTRPATATTVNAGLDYDIPISTAFKLSGKIVNPAADSYTYCWEQNDSALTTYGSKSIAYDSKPDGPLFRSLQPTATPVRYFPDYTSVLYNNLSNKWESVSSIGRTLNFSLTARETSTLDDPRIFYDNVVVNVNADAGPFEVISQNTIDESWRQGSSQKVVWSVNKSNVLKGANAVNIKLSTDGGLTFAIVLATNTPNDGEEVIKVPLDIISNNCRILIEPTDNIFYAINKRPFSIGYKSNTTCNDYNFGDSIRIALGSSFTIKEFEIPDVPGTISDVNFSLQLNHNRIQDLEIILESPSGKQSILYDKKCSSGLNAYSLQFDDGGAVFNCALASEQSVLPTTRLNIFNGEAQGGTWKLKVRDAGYGFTGSVSQISFSICNQEVDTLNPIIDDNDFVVYPNPSNGEFAIQLDSDGMHPIEVKVFDLQGKEVYAITIDASNHIDERIKLPRLTTGVYLISASDSKFKKVKKIMVH